MFRPSFASWMAAAALVAGIGTMSPARADIIADTRDLGQNITSANYVADEANGPGQTFQSFTYNTADSSNYAVNEIQIMVQTLGQSGGSLIVTLWTDDAASDGPGSLVATLSPISLASLAKSFGGGNYGLLDITNLNLAAGFDSLTSGPNYWIGLATTGDPQGNDGTTVGGTENVSYGNPSNPAAQNNNYSDNLGICVSTLAGDQTQTCSSTNDPFPIVEGFGTNPGTDLLALSVNAPEPATLAIFGSAIAGLGFMRRRRDVYEDDLIEDEAV